VATVTAKLQESVTTSESHSTPPVPSGKPAKPPKPYAEFPLTAHPAGYWCKKIRGKLHYFGPWDDPDGALDKYLAEKDALLAGRTPRPDPDALTVKELANDFLNGKQALVDAGELSRRMGSEYKEVCDLLVRQFGKGRPAADLGPSDFAALRNKMAKRWGPVRLGNAIQRIRSVFKHALDADLIARPARFGPGFKRPAKKVLRLHRAAGGPKLFTADEIRRMIDAAGVQLKAMLLLGINCGFGMADCGKLPLSAFDLDGGWADYPRPKTGIPRRCPLWPETVRAVRAALVERTAPKDAAHAGLVFLTARGHPWHKETGGSYAAHKVGKLMRRLGINGRKGLGFYTLRHVFRTVADEAKDQPAADFLMGREVPHMSSVYRERIGDERLKAVAEHVRAWLFPPPEKDKPKPKEEGAAEGGEEA
jgi:integrase